MHLRQELECCLYLRMIWIDRKSFRTKQLNKKNIMPVTNSEDIPVACLSNSIMK